MTRETDRFAGDNGVPKEAAMPELDEVTPRELEELEQFREKLLPYYHRYMDYVARATDPTSPSHPVRMRQIGHHYRVLRRHAGLSRAKVAEEMGGDPVQLAAFEGGLIPPEDLPQGFPERLSQFLGGALGTVPPQDAAH